MQNEIFRPVYILMLSKKGKDTKVTFKTKKKKGYGKIRKRRNVKQFTKHYIQNQTLGKVRPKLSIALIMIEIQTKQFA